MDAVFIPQTHSEVPQCTLRSPSGNITMNSRHLNFAVICFSGLFIFSMCDSGAGDAVVEGSGEVTNHTTDRVPVIEDELSVTQVPTKHNPLSSKGVQTTDDQVKTEEKSESTEINPLTSKGVQIKNDQVKTQEKSASTEIINEAPVPASNANKEAISSNIVFIIAPAVVGTVVVIVVIIAIIAIRRKGRDKLQFTTHGE